MKQRILVIEDNEDVRENLSEILTLYGFDVAEAANGLLGVKAALDQPPALILCDVMMPELDGFGVLNLLMENERTAAIPFVFLTAKTEREDVRRGMNLGADDYLTKPFYKDELLRVVKARLKKAALRSGPATTSATGPQLSDVERGRRLLLESLGPDQERVYAKGEQIVREGDHAHGIYFLQAGQVLLGRAHEYGRDYILAELGPEETFGISSVLEQAPFPYTAKVVSAEARIAFLPKHDFLDLVNRERNVAEALMHLLAGRLLRRSDQLVHQAYDSVRRRTALVLCDLHEKYAGADIQLSREELAQMIGATKESVIRALSDFKREKLLETEGRNIRLLAVKELRTLLV
ncbi:MAG: response regulator [Bacteroidota bacterium]